MRKNQDNKFSFLAFLRLILVSTLMLMLMPTFAMSQQAAPKVGRKAAAKYFQKHKIANNYGEESEQERYPSSVEPLSAQDHYLAFGLSSFTNSKAYNWGKGSTEEDVGRGGVDMTYRLTQDTDLFDKVVRLSYNEYKPRDEKTSKMSFLYGITFPDAGAQFPLYFGAMVGPGVFFKQLSGESSLSLDYQMILGLRLFNIFEKTGFFIEGGLRNHLHLTSDGQLNATAVSAGAVFTF